MPIALVGWPDPEVPHRSSTEWQSWIDLAWVAASNDIVQCTS